MAAALQHKESALSVAKSNQDFTGKLYSLLGTKESNLVVSPFSISSVMAMAYAGAKGNTEKQMKECMAFPENNKVLLEGYEDMFNVLKSNENFTLDAANRLFVDSQYKLLDSYMSVVQSHYKAVPESVEFGKSEEARVHINQWVEKQTHDKIKDLLPGGSISAMTKLVLVNAVYFKGDWANQFDKEITKKEKFTTLDGSQVEVDMMHKFDTEFTGAVNKELDAVIVEMPYKGNRLSMLLFLSKKPEGFAVMKDKFPTIDLVNLKMQGSIKFDVALPRFKLESTHDLVDNLKTIGMTDMFDMTKADFSGISGTNDLFVSSVVQKAFIEVNEEGSEAAAATGMVMMMRSMPARPQQFICDRPFMFAIKDNLTGMVLFTGHVVNPTK
jgi:serpin B